MRALEVMRDMFARLADNIAAALRLSGFVCGDCEKQQQCGLAPSERCVARLAQLDRNGEDQYLWRRRDRQLRQSGIYLGDLN